VLPTAILSTHTGGFTGYTYRDLTEDIDGILAHWRTLGLQFDIVYSGYLGSISQIDIVSKIKKEFLVEGGKFVVDPVMGDNGKLYAGFTPAYVEKMRELCKEADYITPNPTEASCLANIPYSEKIPVENVMSALHALCPNPILTGVDEGKTISVKYLENDEIEGYSTEKIEGFFHGTGDVFGSALVGALAVGKPLATAIKLAADFTTASVRRTAPRVLDKRYGLLFEEEIFSLIKNLNDGSNR
jgi:pyridoxine kinase